ncbi:hypothetical protein JOM56_001585 [Amanita muscaria]
MAGRLTEDPNRAKTPDYTSEGFAPLRAALTTGDRTAEEAVQFLTDTWRDDINRKKLQWAQQLEEERLAEEARRHEQEEGREPEGQNGRNPPLDEQNGQPRSTAPSKPKLNALATGVTISDIRVPRPSSYALKRLEKYDYVDLWYFTEEGCEDAMRFNQSTASDTYTLAKLEDTVSLRPINAAKASRNAISDEKLTWRQMSIAKTSLLYYMTELGWDVAYVRALATFYVALESHPRRRQGTNGDRILILYQAEARREWFQQLTQERIQTVFDISIINKERLRRIDEATHITERDQVMARLLHKIK